MAIVADRAGFDERQFRALVVLAALLPELDVMREVLADPRLPELLRLIRMYSACKAKKEEAR